MLFRLFRSSGATGKACSGGRTPPSPRTPQEEARDRRRRLAYLHRLGIQQEQQSGRGRAGSAKSALEEEDDEQSVLESISCASSFSGDDPIDGGENFRHKFLRKLAYEKVWVTKLHRSPKHQTVIIFDWDDTLLCTWWLRLNHDQNQESDGLRKIGQHAKFLLESAMKLGYAVIVTNAATTWVHATAAKWVPELLPVLEKVPIISARDKFGAFFPDGMSQWKVQTFRMIRRHLLSQSALPITNVIALGDNDFEMEAARIMTEECTDCSPVLKTVKFQPQPTLQEHLKQVQKISERFERIVKSSHALTVTLQRSRKES